MPKADINNIAVNHRAFLTGKNANLGLYKTIFVDQFGKIRFNILNSKDYGFIWESENNLNQSLIFLSKVWNIKRDKIVPCKRCEFRYACTAGFIPEIISPENEKYYVNCNYNPSTNEWNI